jgi:histidine ammonia-lyase
MITLDGAGLRPVDAVSVARDGERVELDPAARARNEAARETIAAVLARGESLYGASTGVGALRERAIADEEREPYQWNLLRSHAVTAGPPLPREEVRAAMVVRANQLGAGGGGVAPPLLDALLTALNSDYIPLTREVSALGTGDLGSLAEIALALLGEGSVWQGDRIVQAPGICGPVTLSLRDGLGFISSNATTLGRAALVWFDASSLLDAWLTGAALSFEAMGADPGVFDEHAHKARGSAHQAAVARRLRALLEGYTPTRTDGGRWVHDPYPFRVLPQVDAVPSGALAALELVLTSELNARGENALIADGRAWPNGNFHGGER